MRQEAGLVALERFYDGFIIDLWGVIHDGVRPYDGALDVLQRLRGRPVLLLSNAPRRAWSAQAMLRRMGVDDSAYTSILTSGEATWLALRDGIDPWFAGLGRHVYHIGPERDRNVLEGLDRIIVQDPALASFVLNTGPDDARDDQDIIAFESQLVACRAHDLKMICANPDRVVMRAGTPILCAGALADRYEDLGGEVRRIGKPDPAIYALALDMLGLKAARALAIGDSLHTDVAGAAGAGIDCVWILGGIHHKETRGSAAAAERLVAEAGLQPKALMQSLVW